MDNKKAESLCVVVYFPVGTGGKFIINSLGLSKHCVLHDHNLAKWDISQTVFDHTYYQTKLDHILDTVPPTNKLANWQKYELGIADRWLRPPNWGRDLEEILTDRHFCVIAHTPEVLKLYFDTFPKIKNVVKLTNYIEWLKLSKFKVSSLHDDFANIQLYWDYVDKKEIAEMNYPYKLVDIDNNIHDSKCMLETIKNLYKELNFDDFCPDLWLQYYNKYIRVHK